MFIRPPSLRALRGMMGRQGFGSLVALGLVLLAVVPVAARGESAPVPSPAWDAPPSPAAFVPFSSNVRVNSGGTGYNFQVEPTMAVNSQGRIFVGWKEAITHNGGGRRVAFSYSSDDGASWAPNILMDLLAYGLQSDPWLTVTTGDRVDFSRIAYDSPTSPGGIVISNTTDGGTWGTPLLLDDAPNFADKQSHATDPAGNLYMVWNSDATSGSSYQLMFARSNDGGATWTPKVRVPDSTNGHLGGFVQVAPNGTVLVTWWSWANVNVWFDRSTDGGATWGTDVRVNDIPGSADSPLASDPPVLPAMAVAANGTIYVVWNDYRNGRPSGAPNGDFDIMFSRSTDLGATWSPARQLNDDTTTARQWMPDLAVDPFGGVHVAWMDDRLGEHNVFYVNSTDGGTTWGPNVRVSQVGTPLTFTRPGDYLALESDPQGNIVVVWTDGRGADLDVYFARLERTIAYTVGTVPSGRDVVVDGQSFTTPVTLDWLPGSSHTIATASPQPGAAGIRYVFDSWSDGGGQGHAVIAPQTNGGVVASFRTEYLATISTTPGLEVIVDNRTFVDAMSEWWLEGTQHTVRAPSPQQTAPGVRHLFTGWSDGGPAQNRTETATAPITLAAAYDTQYELSIVSPHGTPTGAGWYNASTEAIIAVENLVAGTPGTRFAFVDWTGGATAGTPSAVVVMDGPKAVTARWRTEYLLTIQSTYGTPTGAGWYGEGETANVTINATVAVNGTTYRFAGWAGDASGTNATVGVRMDGPKTIRAEWEEVVPEPPTQTSMEWGLWLVLLGVAFLLIVAFLWRRRRKKEEPPPQASP